LELGLIPPGDIDPPWDDFVVAVKAGIEEAKLDRSKRRAGATSTTVASADERAALLARIKSRG